MKMVLAIAALLVAGNVAFAAEGNDISEFQQHAMGGQLEVTPHLMYDMRTVNTGTPGATDTKINGFRLGSEVEYGVMERLSVGADLTYRSWTIDSTPETKVSGLEDVILFTRGSSAMGMGRLTYGANLGVSLGDNETEANGDENAQTGGLSLAPYVGYEMMMGPGVLGAQLKYSWLGDRTQVNGGATGKEKDGGGIGLAAFYEYGISDTAGVGAAVTYAMNGETKDDTGAANGDKKDVLGLQVYAPIAVGATMELVPRLNWSSVSYDASSAVDDSTISLGADLRMLF